MLNKIKDSSANMKLAAIRYWELDAARQSQLEHLRLLRELAKPVQDKVKILKTIPGVGEIVPHTLVAYLRPVLRAGAFLKRRIGVSFRGSLHKIFSRPNFWYRGEKLIRLFRNSFRL